MAADDPEGMEYWEATQAARNDDPDIHLFADLQDVVINVFQQVSTVVVQKSIREGFGLTVSEALWKERPVLGGRAGGITLQVQDGVSGYLVDSPGECARRAIELFKDPEKAREMGARGRAHVRQNFLATRELEDYLQLFASLSGSSAQRRVAAAPGRAG